MAADVLMRALDADRHRVGNLGDPLRPRDATFTDNEVEPSATGRESLPGKSLRAAPADHVHASPAPMRIAAAGVTTLSPGARVTLASVARAPGEMFASGGFAFVRDDVAGITWESEAEGATHVGLYHERTRKPGELAFRAYNAGDAARTLEWASVALSLPVT